MAMIMLQLNPFIEIYTEKGPALARVLIDYGPEINGCFLASLEETGQFLYFDVTKCKMAENYTYGVQKPNV